MSPRTLWPWLLFLTGCTSMNGVHEELVHVSIRVAGFVAAEGIT